MARFHKKIYEGSISEGDFFQAESYTGTVGYYLHTGSPFFVTAGEQLLVLDVNQEEEKIWATLHNSMLQRSVNDVAILDMGLFRRCHLKKVSEVDVELD